MGCANTKEAGEPVEGGVAAGENVSAKQYVDARSPEMEKLAAEEQQEQPEKRLSVRYSAKDSSNRTSSRRRSSAPFDKSRIGVFTKHGLRPGPRGTGVAKINQDRGVVCWPFNDSFNEALLCIFDGHGRRGEEVSEYAMITVPELLEGDHKSLEKDATKCLEDNIIKTDKMLFASPLGPTARNCGSTSTVVYLRADQCWCACSGDSRAVKGMNRNGTVVAADLSNDHKPELPEEKARILAAGGTVTPSGPDGRPSRMYADGHVGLAMSRSLGDGLCKDYGCIPDPEVQQFTLRLPPKSGPQGEEVDSFLIVASDGVWEFITSQEACELVSKFESATDAVTQLVQEASDRWHKFEGTYRDDITAIVVYLPFLEGDGAPAPPAPEPAADAPADPSHVTLATHHANGTPIEKADGDDDGEDEAKPLYINKGASHGNLLTGDDATAAEGASPSGGKEFVKRRLSVSAPDDDDWGDEEGQ